jgi:hypothetical protein
VTLSVQDYLQTPGHTLETLHAELGIEVVQHEAEPLVILNYSQINSPRFHPITRECRGLVLENVTYGVVARSFPRFFNAGEHEPSERQFDWKSAVVQEKHDGSLALLYHYDGRWRMNMRGSFAQGQLHPSQKTTWQEYFWGALPCSTDTVERLPKGYTYVFELCGPLNKIVRRYEKPTAYLLTVYDNKLGHEVPDATADLVAHDLECPRPEVYSLGSMHAVLEHLKMENLHPTFEGFVIRDQWGNRLKVKNSKYVALHHLRGNGDDVFNPKNLVPFILGTPHEQDELLTYFPEVTETYNRFMGQITMELMKTTQVWDQAKDIDNQKAFALYIKDRVHPVMAGVLFNARKTNQHPEEVFKKDPGYALKILKN